MHSHANKIEPIQLVRSALGPGFDCSGCSVGSQPANWFLRAADAMAAWLTQVLGQGQKWGSLASQCFLFCFGADELVPEPRPALNTRGAPPVRTSCRKMSLCAMGCVGSTLTQSRGWDPPSAPMAVSSNLCPRLLSNLEGAEHTGEEPEHPTLDGALPVSSFL